MSNNDNSTTTVSTRRDALKYGGTLVTGSVLAGCSELVGQGDPTQQADGSGSYEACIEPVGCLSLEEVPETWMAINGPWADMAVALGQREGFEPAGFYAPAYFFDRVGVSMPSDVRSPLSNGWDKELFYELDPDVILCDPTYLHGTGFDSSWDESDTQELEDTVAPFFGNNIVRRREFHTYELPSLYEAFDRLADLFQERERYEAFARVHDGMQTEIRSRLPGPSDRPEVGLVNFGSVPREGTFHPMTTEGEGVEMKTYRDLDVESTFSADQGELDYESMLEVDPEILIVHGGVRLTDDTGEYSASKFREQFIDPMEADSVGSQLTAVRDGNVYPGPHFQQGPIVNLFQTELTARVLYPDEFGEFDPETFPDVPDEERLFDRQRVANIIEGEFEQ
ncbi:ferrichrome-binding protein (plasmid) [Halostagnicola larsenii XH-48]|uniref:Ferrichrome-binding protein n=1 Tax=Halostagnicola larsenii XH-48 TaxID=797299 RepID=W0JWY8_9EURY|nr:ABC transporter substrate-binding protein [Halostagnicola larsenii]AHG01568.1 ferrichrome-binding protein [Halostagnicola larsenii XH-48]